MKQAYLQHVVSGFVPKCDLTQAPLDLKTQLRSQTQRSLIVWMNKRFHPMQLAALKTVSEDLFQRLAHQTLTLRTGVELVPD